MGNVLTDLPDVLDQYRVPRRHVVHVGGHEGQEIPIYRAAGFDRITVVEPIPYLARRLQVAHPDVTVIECACSDTTGVAGLRIMQPDNMSTLAEPAPGDRVAAVTLVRTRRLDDIAPDANVAVIDVQGHELRVLAAAPWHALDLIVVETCTVPDRTVAAGYREVVDVMAGRGFVEVHRWDRDLDPILRWARGKGQPPTGGLVRDVAFARGHLR